MYRQLAQLLGNISVNRKLCLGFGLVLVLGDPEGHLVLPTYLYKLTNKLGTPSYHLMAAVAVCLVMVTMPLVMIQRWLLKSANKYVSIKGKGARSKAMPLGRWKWLAFALLAGWLVYGHIPDQWAVLGMLVIALCGAASAWLSIREAK